MHTVRDSCLAGPAWSIGPFAATLHARLRPAFNFSFGMVSASGRSTGLAVLSARHGHHQYQDRFHFLCQSTAFNGHLRHTTHPSSSTRHPYQQVFIGHKQVYTAVVASSASSFQSGPIPGPERDPGFKSVMTSPHVTSFDHVVSGFLLSFSVNFWLFFVASLLSRGVLESVRWRVGCWVSNPWSR